MIYRYGLSKPIGLASPLNPIGFSGLHGLVMIPANVFTGFSGTGIVNFKAMRNCTGSTTLQM